MNLKFLQTNTSNFTAWVLILSGFMLLSGCNPEGFINKVKYRGEKYINTCESFTADINKLIQNNSKPGVLKVSKYDNTDFSYFYLEPGQAEVKGDTLFLRLIDDLPYEQYLDKGVAVHVDASYKASDNLKTMAKQPTGALSTLIVDRAYYLKNRKPFFMYKIPVNGTELAGKQLLLNFSVAKYDKKGNVKQFFCESDTQPLGIAMPACCTSIPWEETQLQSVIDFPEISVIDEAFKYKGFTGTIDVLFPESKSDWIDSTFQVNLIQSYIHKYKDLGYKITRIDLSGWASPGGKETYNLKLSQKRAMSLKDGLKVLNGSIKGLEITAGGMGEDWGRVEFLTKVSTRLMSDEKDQALEIYRDPALTNDQKEAKLRRMKFWEILVDDALIPARHTFVVMDFEYSGTGGTLQRFAERLPVASSRLEEVAQTVFKVSPYQEGMQTDQELATINQLLTQKASPNLYAMRATYHLAEKDYKNTIADLERAASFRDANSIKYNVASQGYKVVLADEYNLDEKKELFNEFTELTKSNPLDKKLFFNRTIIMEKMGLLNAALAEYEALLDGATPTAAQLNNRGVSKLKANMFTDAGADFTAALSANPELAEGYYNMAAIYAYKGLTRKTLEFLDKAIARNADYKSYIFNNPVFSIMSEDPRFDKYRE